MLKFKVKLCYPLWSFGSTSLTILVSKEILLAILFSCDKVDEANVDASSVVKSSSQWIWALEAWGMVAIACHDQWIWNYWNRSWGRCWFGFQNQQFHAFQYGVIRGYSFIIQCCVSGWHHQQILHEAFANEDQVLCQYWLCHALKWTRVIYIVVKLVFHHRICHITNWSAPQSHIRPPNVSKLLPLNVPTLSTKFKCVIAWWITLFIMEDGGYSLIFAKVTNANIIKVAIKSPWITHTLNLINYAVNKSKKNRCPIK